MVLLIPYIELKCILVSIGKNNRQCKNCQCNKYRLIVEFVNKLPFDDEFCYVLKTKLSLEAQTMNTCIHHDLNRNGMI
jgi:hypothetical protein